MFSEHVLHVMTIIIKIRFFPAEKIHFNIAVKCVVCTILESETYKKNRSVISYKNQQEKHIKTLSCYAPGVQSRKYWNHETYLFYINLYHFKHFNNTVISSFSKIFNIPILSSHSILRCRYSRATNQIMSVYRNDIFLLSLISRQAPYNPQT